MIDGFCFWFNSECCFPQVLLAGDRPVYFSGFPFASLAKSSSRKSFLHLLQTTTPFMLVPTTREDAPFHSTYRQLLHNTRDVCFGNPTLPSDGKASKPFLRFLWLFRGSSYKSSTLQPWVLLARTQSEQDHVFKRFLAVLIRVARSA